jgi:polar amino acid transport system substrate-binding protein
MFSTCQTKDSALIRSKELRRTAPALAVGVAMLALSACGNNAAPGEKTNDGNQETASVPAPAKDAALAARLPKPVRDKGVLVMASDASYPPFESVDDNENVVGLDPELAKAIGAVLGIKVEVKNAAFDAIIPGLAAKKYDFAMSSLGDTKEREKAVDFVTYYQNVTQALVKAGNPLKLSTGSLCGARVAVARGTLQQSPMGSDFSAACEAKGKKPLTVSAYKDTQSAILAVTSGRADAVLADAPPLAVAVKESGSQLAVVGPSLMNPNPGGIAVPKDSGLTKAFQGALEKLMADGTYTKILARWGLKPIAIDEPVINGARS